MFIGCIHCKRGFNPFEHDIDLENATVICPFCEKKLQLSKKDLKNALEAKRTLVIVNDNGRSK